MMIFDQATKPYIPSSILPGAQVHLIGVNIYCPDCQAIHQGLEVDAIAMRPEPDHPERRVFLIVRLFSSFPLCDGLKSLLDNYPYVPLYIDQSKNN